MSTEQVNRAFEVRPAVYFRSVVRWYNGVKRFETQEYYVDVIDETEKSYRVRYKGSIEGVSWVGKDKVKFEYLSKEHYCELKSRYIPQGGCETCYNRECLHCGKFYPKE